MRLQISPTGNTYGSEWEALNAKKYEYEIARENSIMKQIKIIKFQDLKPQEGWSQSNEPEDHLDEIAAKLTDYVIPRNILCFSYKDQSLARRMFGTNHCKTETMYDIAEGIINKYPEDRTEVSEDIDNILEDGKYDLIIIRHYLEHFTDCERIISRLKDKLAKVGVIYLEVPDCEKFIDKNIPLYLWEQHRYYFTKNSLQSMLKNTDSGFSRIESYGDSIEPSLCTIIRKNKERESCDNSNEHQNVVIEHDIDIETYKQKWDQLITKNNDKEIIIFGAGHNADRFIQLTDVSYSIDKIVDDNPLKVGRYLSGVNKKIEDSTYLRNKSDMVILLGCHDRSIKACTKNIREINSRAKIYSIYDMPD